MKKGILTTLALAVSLASGLTHASRGTDAETLPGGKKGTETANSLFMKNCIARGIPPEKCAEGLKALLAKKPEPKTFKSSSLIHFINWCHENGVSDVICAELAQTGLLSQKIPEKKIKEAFYRQAAPASDSSIR